MQQHDEILVLKNINKQFGYGKNRVHAVKDVNMTLEKGKIVAIVGESGSGKTTLAKIILGLGKANSGTIEYEGKPLELKTTKQHRDYWRQVQSVFQDPFACFNMFYNVKKLLDNCLIFLGEKLETPHAERLKKEACHYVNLDYDEIAHKHAFELSGGQMQRVMIARIFLLKPSVLIADEPTSMIDACSRMQILEMLVKMSQDIGMSIILITHDIGLAYYMSDTLYIMENGRVVESGDAEQVLRRPQATYTINLLNDVPTLDRPWLI